MGGPAWRSLEPAACHPCSPPHLFKMLSMFAGNAVAARVRATPVKRDVRVMAATQRKGAAKAKPSGGAGAGRTLWLPNTVRRCARWVAAIRAHSNAALLLCRTLRSGWTAPCRVRVRAARCGLPARCRCACVGAAGAAGATPRHAFVLSPDLVSQLLFPCSARRLWLRPAWPRQGAHPPSPGRAARSPRGPPAARRRGRISGRSQPASASFLAARPPLRRPAPSPRRPAPRLTRRSPQRTSRPSTCCSTWTRWTRTRPSTRPAAWSAS